MTKPKINSIQVTRTMEYSPEEYLSYCDGCDSVPTQEGFLEFIQDWIDEDFRNDNGVEEIHEIL